MSNPAVTVVALIREIKEAVAYVEKDGSVKISRVELDLKTTLERTDSGEFTWQVLTLGGSSKNTETQTLHIKFEPIAAGDHGLETLTLKDDLITAINVIKIGMGEAERQPPRFKLEEANVEFGFDVTQEGKIQLFKIGPSGKDDLAHTVKLTLTKPAKSP